MRLFAAVLVGVSGLAAAGPGAPTGATPGGAVETPATTSDVDQAALTAPPTTALPATGLFHPSAPRRVLDTRNGVGWGAAVGSNGVIGVQVSGIGSVPVGASAVVLNVTVVNPAQSGYLSVYPSDATSPPNASNLNFDARETIPNLVTVKLGSDGGVSFFNGSSGSTHVLADVMGWYDSFFRPEVTDGTYFVGTSPQRFIDTRSALGIPSGSTAPVGPGGILNVPIRGRNTVPPSTSITGVVMNVTAVSPTDGGYLTVYPSGGSLPDTSSLNFAAGQTAPNLVITQLGSDGAVNIYNDRGFTHVLVDVVGYFTADRATAGIGQMFAVPPTRIFDTRDGTGSGAVGPIGPGGDVPVTIAGVAGLPTTGVSSVVVNVTAASPTAGGYLTVYPSGAGLPIVSNLNLSPGDTVPNLVTTKVGADGKIRIYNFTGNTHVIVDVVGWYADATPFTLGTSATKLADGAGDAGDTSQYVRSDGGTVDTARWTQDMVDHAVPLPLPERGDAIELDPAVDRTAGFSQPNYPTYDGGYLKATDMPGQIGGTPGPIGRLYGLETSTSTSLFGCSATVIARDLVLTAAHCVYDASAAVPGFYFSWGFAPGQYGGVNLAAGSANNPSFWTTQAAYLTSAYANRFDPWFQDFGLASRDFAILKFAPKTINGVTKYIGDVTGWYPVLMNSDLSPRLVVGYPGGSTQTAPYCTFADLADCFPYFCFSPVSGSWANAPAATGLAANSYEVGIGCATPAKVPSGPAGGISGGPWLTKYQGQWYVSSVTSNGLPVTSNGVTVYLRNIWGPYFDSTFESFLTFVNTN